MPYLQEDKREMVKILHSPAGFEPGSSCSLCFYSSATESLYPGGLWGRTGVTQVPLRNNHHCITITLSGTRLSVAEGLRRQPDEQEVPGSSPAGETDILFRFVLT